MTQLAFPTAEGAGRYAQGGRGAPVYYVTNTNDSGAGSLRTALSNSGPKNILFQVSGTIRLLTDIKIGGETDSYLTISGQTAPGGIQIADRSITALGGIHDVIIRHVRFRNNVTNNLTGSLINKSLLFWNYWVDTYYHDMCYDAFRSQTICYGGWDDTFNTETWSWNGSSWTLLTSTGPDERTEHCMAYNSTSHNTVLYGGRQSGYDYSSSMVSRVYTDTWEWNGSAWTEIVTANAPPARVWTAIAYDPVRNETVLFGGNNSSTYYDDTWVYDGTNWTQKSPVTIPTARHMHSMAWDPVNSVVVLFGGITSSSSYLQDTYTWNGTNWTLVAAVTKPPVRGGHRLVSYSTGVLLFGGHNSTDSLSDTYTWNGANWTLISPAASPEARYAHAISYDGSNVTVFSGNVFEDSSGRLHDTWTFNGTNWTKTTENTGPPTDIPTIHDVILDHCSLEWGCDGSLGLLGVDKFTIQNCFISEGSYYGDVVQGQGMNASGTYRKRDGTEGSLSIHRNLFAENAVRVPQIYFNNGICNFINNVSYNYSLGLDVLWAVNDFISTQSTKCNIISNVWKQPKGTKKGDPGYSSYNRWPIHLDGYSTIARGGANFPPLNNNSIYVYDNYDDNKRSSPSDSEWFAGMTRYASYAYSDLYSTSNVGVSSNTAPQKLRSLERFDTFEVSIEPASTLESSLGLTGSTPDVGANLPSLDSVDARILSEYQTKTGFAGVGKNPQENPNPTPSTYGMSSRGKLGGTSIDDQPPLPNTQRVRYSPYEITYTLTNNAAHAIDWTVTKPAGFDWLSISSGGGTLAAGAHVDVTLTIDTSGTSPADLLANGIYNCIVTITNVTDALTAQRVIPLEIYEDTVKLKMSQVFLNSVTTTRSMESPALIPSSTTLYYHLWNESTTDTLNYTISFTNNTSTIISLAFDENGNTISSLAPSSYIRVEARLAALGAIVLPCYATVTVTAGAETVNKYIVYNPNTANPGDLAITNYDTYLVNPNAIVPWPEMAAGAIPTDTDSDGIPDANEAGYGLNSLVSDAHNLHSSGYSYLELYMNSLAGD